MAYGTRRFNAAFTRALQKKPYGIIMDILQCKYIVDMSIGYSWKSVIYVPLLNKFAKNGEISANKNSQNLVSKIKKKHELKQ